MRTGSQPRSSRSDGSAVSATKSSKKRGSGAPSPEARPQSRLPSPPFSSSPRLATSSGPGSRSPEPTKHRPTSTKTPEDPSTVQRLSFQQPPSGSPSSFRGRIDLSTSSSILVTNGTSGGSGGRGANATLRPNRAERLDGAVLEAAAAVRLWNGAPAPALRGHGAPSPVYMDGSPLHSSSGPRRRCDSSLTSHSSVLSSPRGVGVPARSRTSLRVHLSRRAFIGKGSFGVVYKAMDTDTNQLLAVKEIMLSGLAPALTPAGSSGANSATSTTQAATKEKRIAAVKKELAFLRQLNHPNVVQCLGEEVEDDCLRIYMEYVAGGSVSSLIKTFGTFQERQASAFARQILHGLAYLHAKSIIHRDLKGDNLLVDTHGQLKLADFGTARDLRSTAASVNGSLAGTAYFAAPELVHGNAIDTKADIWSTACCVIEMLTGSPPLSHIGNQYAIMMMLAQADEKFYEHYIPEDNDWSESLLDFLHVCLQKDATKRPTAQELLRHEWITRPPLRNSSHTTQEDDVLAVTVTSVIVPDPIPPAGRRGSVEDSMLDMTGIAVGSPCDSRNPGEDSVVAPDLQLDPSKRVAKKVKKRKKTEKSSKSKGTRRAKSVGATPASLSGIVATSSLESPVQERSGARGTPSHPLDSPLPHTSSCLQLNKSSHTPNRNTDAETRSAGFLPVLSPSFRGTGL